MENKHADYAYATAPYYCTLLLIIRSFVCNMKRPSVKRSIKWQVSSNFQIYPGKTDEPPHLKLPEC